MKFQVLATLLLTTVLVVGCGDSASVVPDVHKNTSVDSGSTNDASVPPQDAGSPEDSSLDDSSTFDAGNTTDSGSSDSGDCSCPGGEVCFNGVCVVPDPCEGVSCPSGSVCKEGTCVPTDPCDGVNCSEGSVCIDGVCVPTDPCAGVTCPAGKVCQNGTCTCDGEPTPDAGQCGDDKTLMCHYPPGNPGNDHNVCVGNAAVSAHLAHGDKLGACP